MQTLKKVHAQTQVQALASCKWLQLPDLVDEPVDHCMTTVH